MAGYERMQARGSGEATLTLRVVQVELTELLQTSSVRYFNTQTGGAEEYVTVLVSDQGASGASGVAETDSLRIDVTVVAVNNPPAINIEVIEYLVRHPHPTTSFSSESAPPHPSPFVQSLLYLRLRRVRA